MAILASVDIALRHERVVRGVHPAQLGLEVLVGCRRDVRVADLRRYLVHALPPHNGHDVGVAGGDGQGPCQHGMATGGAARLDFDVAQGIEAEIIMDLGGRQQLVSEVVGEL